MVLEPVGSGLDVNVSTVTAVFKARPYGPPTAGGGAAQRNTDQDDYWSVAFTDTMPRGLFLLHNVIPNVIMDIIRHS